MAQEQKSSTVAMKINKASKRVETLNSFQLYENGQRVYSPNNKPSASAIGAARGYEFDAQFKLEKWSRIAKFTNSSHAYGGSFSITIGHTHGSAVTQETFMCKFHHAGGNGSIMNIGGCGYTSSKVRLVVDGGGNCFFEVYGLKTGAAYTTETTSVSIYGVSKGLSVTTYTTWTDGTTIPSGWSTVECQTESGKISLNGHKVYTTGNKPTLNDLSGKAADSDKLDGLDSGSFLRSDADDSFSGALVSTARDKGIFGTYDSHKTDQIWSMGTAFKNSSTGADFGNLYGLAYKHTNNTTGGTMADGHQMVWCTDGTPQAALGDGGIWSAGFVKGSYGEFSSVDAAPKLKVIRTNSDTNINIAFKGNGSTTTYFGRGADGHFYYRNDNLDVSGAGHKIYSTGNKPTPNEIGALPLTGGTITGELSTTGNDINIRRPNTTGGWARGLIIDTTEGGTAIAGIGVYGGNTTAEYISLGFGTNWWDGATNTFKADRHGNTYTRKVHHANNLYLTGSERQHIRWTGTDGSAKAYIWKDPDTDFLTYSARGVHEQRSDFTKGIKATGYGNDYHTSGIEIIGNGAANTVFPTLGFHQPSKYASSIQLKSAANFHFMAQGGSSHANIHANGLYSHTGKLIHASADSWLRLNPSNNFSSGIYCASSLVRTDGTGFDIGDYHYSRRSVRIQRGSGTTWGVDKAAFIDLGGAPTTGSTATYLIRYKDTSGKRIFAIDTLDQGGQSYIRIGTSATYHFGDNGSFTSSGNVGAYSDERIKTDIKVIDNAIDKVKQIRGVTYKRTDIEDESRHCGVIAQEIEKVLPEVVSTKYNDESDIKDFKTVQYGNITALLIEAIKELSAKVEKLEGKGA